MSHHKHPHPQPPERPKTRMIYSLLRGAVTAAKPFSSNPARRPHYHLLIENDTGEFDVAINMVSEDPHAADVRVLYAIKDATGLPILAGLRTFTGTIADLAPGSNLRLDYVTQNIVSQDEMKPLPIFDSRTAFGAPNDIMKFVDQTVRDPNAIAYVFGHRYTEHAPRNDAWRFSPDDGVHNIHMNQGNARGNHDDENGRFSDGALVIHHTDTDRWQIACIAFQTQSWKNDDRGYPL